MNIDEKLEESIENKYMKNDKDKNKMELTIEESVYILKRRDFNMYVEDKAIETLLTAYEKEKGENMSYYYHIQGLEDDIRMHYISTYKIEKEIKKIKDSNTYGYVGEEWNDRDVVKLLENLISKEE